jgi:hypothetical protein
MGRRSTPIRRTSFVVNQGRKSNGRMSAAPTATIVRLSVRRWQRPQTPRFGKGHARGNSGWVKAPWLRSRRSGMVEP